MTRPMSWQFHEWLYGWPNPPRPEPIRTIFGHHIDEATAQQVERDGIEAWVLAHPVEAAQWLSEWRGAGTWPAPAPDRNPAYAQEDIT